MGISFFVIFKLFKARDKIKLLHNTLYTTQDNNNSLRQEVNTKAKQLAKLQDEYTQQTTLLSKIQGERNLYEKVATAQQDRNNELHVIIKDLNNMITNLKIDVANRDQQLQLSDQYSAQLEEKCQQNIAMCKNELSEMITNMSTSLNQKNDTTLQEILKLITVVKEELQSNSQVAKTNSTTISTQLTTLQQKLESTAENLTPETKTNDQPADTPPSNP